MVQMETVCGRGVTLANEVEPSERVEPLSPESVERISRVVTPVGPRLTFGGSQT